MPVGLIGGAISGGTSLISGLLGQNAAGKAAKAEQLAAQQAEQYQKQQTGNATAAQQNATTAIAANLQPFVGTGQQATNSLAGYLAPGGQLTQSYAGLNGQFTAPTAAQAEATPGYQFQLQQGMNALQNSAAARGGLLSTGTAKNLENYAQGVASTNYQNTYNNALNAYSTNANLFNQAQQNLYGFTSGAANSGLSAAGTLSGLQQSGANSLANIYMQSGQQIGQDILGAGQSQAAGIVGGNNALTAGLTGAGNTIGQAITLGQLSGAQNASNQEGPMAGIDPSTLNYRNSLANLPTSGGYYQ